MNRITSWSLMRKLHRRYQPMRRLVACAAAGVVAASTLAGCGGGGGGAPVLTWFAMPNNGGAVTSATECVEASGGAYRVQVETLPNNATQQREQLVRRLESIGVVEY
jgi:trehalose/maltose transport system substrate-binding protein